MSRFHNPYSKDVRKLFKKSPQIWIALMGTILSMICYFFIMIYAFAGGKAHSESARHDSVAATSYRYDLCRKEYLASGDEYQPYRDIFEKLDTIFIGPMSITTYNNGIDLYSKQSDEFKLYLNTRINCLTDDTFIPEIEKETRAVRSAYLSNDSLTTYASNTKKSLAYFGWIICILPIIFVILFELPNKDLSVSSIILELLVR